MDSKNFKGSLKVISPNVKYTDEYITTNYTYSMTDIKPENGNINVYPRNVSIGIRTGRKIPKLGVMLVGWGGNNGSTFTAGIVAHKLEAKWKTKDGLKSSNWLGSITQCATVKIGIAPDGTDFYWPLSGLLPIVNPDDIVLDGWDISSADLATAMKRAKVLDYNLQEQLRSIMEKYKPRPSIYYGDFIAANQADRADNLINCSNKAEALKHIRNDIKDFKEKSGVDKIVIIWTANTERFCNLIPGQNDTAQNLLLSIQKNHSEISPSTLFAVASIQEGCIYINGSPQNTFVPGLIELAEKSGVFIGGDDFKSGQTKLKSVLVDFLVSAGIKPVSIVSYNHLGNNDGRNLSAPQQFRSKEISKSNVVDDMVASNRILYEPDEKPDHCVVIKYVPYVGDSKRALDEYISEICLGGHNTISIHNTCEDSLLASPIILDLVIIAELSSRIQFFNAEHKNPIPFNNVLSILSYLLKAPLVPKGTPVVNSLFKQRACIENIMKACLGIPPDHNMTLEHKLPAYMFGKEKTTTEHQISANDNIMQNDPQIKDLLELSVSARELAYVPYSKFKVGAAILCKDGSMYSGCNVENSSYPMTTCAERTAVVKAVSENNRQFVAISVCAAFDQDNQTFIYPCGSCRQLLAEFTASDLTVYTVKPDDITQFRQTTLNHLLPNKFKMRK